MHGHTGLGQPLAKYFFSYMRLEGPRLIFTIVPADAPIEFPRQAADGGLVADVGEPQAAGRHPADARARFEQHHRTIQPRRLNRGDDSAGGRAMDADVGLDDSFRTETGKIWIKITGRSDGERHGARR